MTPAEALAKHLLRVGDMTEYVPFLKENARGNILEIGTRDGVSTSAFLSGLEANGGHLWSVDINESSASLFPGHPQWTFIHADSQDANAVYRIVYHVDFDVLLIDGDHSYEGASSDLRNYAPLVRPGGLVLMHDVEVRADLVELARESNWLEPEETRQAWDEFVAAHPTWHSYIMPGRFGMGVIVKGER